MKCPGCQREFDESRIADACKACPSGGGCHNVRCPYCGYETPREPGLVKAIRGLVKRVQGSGFRKRILKLSVKRIPRTLPPEPRILNPLSLTLSRSNP